MSALVRPITGYLPTSAHGSRIVGPPRSMLTPDAASAGSDDPLSFRHVVGRRAGPAREVASIWLKLAAELDAFREVDDAVVVHAAERGGIRALGMLVDVSLEAYRAGSVKVHEKTIEKTERKMIDYMAGTRLYGNPVVLAHRDDATLAAALAGHCDRPPDVAFTAADHTAHQLWVVSGPDAAALCSAVVGDLYIADGHHRLAAAASLAEEEGRSGGYLPAGLYAEHEFVVAAFARGVTELGISAKKLVARLEAEFDMTPIDDLVPRPTERHCFGVRVGERSFLLKIPDAQVTGDVFDRLDVNLLQHQILEQHLGIDDPRRDARLEFIADTASGVHEPDRFDAWFLPFPTSVGEVMEVADLGRTMPPKSTFFMPKIPGGLLVRPLDS